MTFNHSIRSSRGYIPFICIIVILPVVNKGSVGISKVKKNLSDLRSESSSVSEDH